MKIPIQNIYYLLCYAWNNLEERDRTKVNSEKSTDLVDLFAKVLINGITYLFKRGLNRQYIVFEEDISSIRGKLNISNTIKQNLLRKSKTWCEFDELSYNVLHNQILKATINSLLHYNKLDNDLKRSLKEIFKRFYTVDLIKLESHLFNKVRLDRNNQYYKFLLNVCQIIFDNLVINEENGELEFADFVRDESQMARLFENFVKNFYKHEQKVFNVHSEYISWGWQSEDEDAMRLLPKMLTDVSLERDSQKIIIDTKYYKNALTNRYEANKLISPNLYQIFAYLNNIKQQKNDYEIFEGILLYPTVSYSLNKTYYDRDLVLHIKTIDLNQNWMNIRKNLLDIVNIRTI